MITKEQIIAFLDKMKMEYFEETIHTSIVFYKETDNSGVAFSFDRYNELVDIYQWNDEV